LDEVRKEIDAMESEMVSCCNTVVDARPFQDVTIMTSQPGRMRVISPAMSAAEYILTDWPNDEGEKLSIAKHCLLSCLECKLSPGAARIAFIEAAKEADIYVDLPGRPPPTGKLQPWHKGKPRRRS
jgi:Protein of unknown function (DUF982)